MVDCCFSKMLFSVAAPPESATLLQTSYSNAKTPWFVIQKRIPLISHSIVAINCHAAIGWQSNAIVAAFPLCSLHDPTFVAAAAEVG